MKVVDFIGLCNGTQAAAYQDYSDEEIGNLLLTAAPDFITYEQLYKLQDCLYVKQFVEGDRDCELAARIISHINSVVGGGKDKHFYPLSDPNWQQAIGLMKADFEHGDNRFNQVLMPRKPRNLKYAESLKRLIKRGLTYKFDENYRLVFDDTERAILREINDTVREIGGVRFLNELFSTLHYDGNLHRFLVDGGRNTMSPLKREVEYPVNYMLNLGIRHIKHAGEKVADIKAAMQDIMELCRDMCFVEYPVQAWDIWNDIFHADKGAMEYLQALVFKKSIYGLDQASPVFVRQLCNFMVNYHVNHQGLFTIPEELDLQKYMLLMDFCMNIADDRRIVKTHKSKIRTRLSRMELEALLSVVAIRESKVNDGYNDPSDYLCVNHWPYPLIIDNKDILTMLPKPIMAWAWLEAVMGILRKQNRNFDGEMGTIIECFLKERMTKRGIRHVCGEYEIPVKGECDHVVVASDRLFFIEDKKKPLTRSAYSGNTDDIIIDLAKSLVLAQEQCHGHAEDLIKNHGLDMMEKETKATYHLDDSIAKFDYISLSLSDYGPAHMRFLTKRILDTFHNSQFGVNTSVYSDPDDVKRITKSIKQVNHYLDELRKHISFLSSVKSERPYQAFFDSWFLSLEQMTFLIEQSSSSDELKDNMRKIKFGTHGCYDFYMEWLMMNGVSA